MKKALLLGLAAGVIGSVFAFGEERLTMWGTPPREKPHMTKGGESFPPLPLPVVPQRRTEKKRPPAPPKLIANVENISFDGWRGSPGAVDTLLRTARQRLKLWYGWEQLDIRSVVRAHTSGVIQRTPVLFMCAYYPVAFDAATCTALRDYLLNGGTVVVNCCGRRDAFASVRDAFEQVLPKHPLRRLPADHPLYHAYYDITQVRYPVPSESPLDAGAEEAGPPRLQAVTLGTRAAVLVSLEDMACGWNQWNNPSAVRLHPEDSNRLGLNLLTYVAAEQRLAKFLARTREISGPNLRPREQLVLPQIVHDGNWNPNPSALPFLLKDVASRTSIAVQFELRPMPIKDPSLFDYPVLYLTGSWDPALSREELALLRRYLTAGGTLLADAASGRAEFDRAFRSICAELFPGEPLVTLPADHPLYSCFHAIDHVALNHTPDAAVPEIEMLKVDGRPAVLYSRYGLSDGWAHEFSAYARAYATPDALKLGANLLVFVMQ
ncbi:MAG: DUF4159 domain-containing protein [Lentisphaerae bacterium]|nr:DUF4159 domain-containing protein [Lentisphaerota bacterium]